MKSFAVLFFCIVVTSSAPVEEVAEDFLGRQEEHHHSALPHYNFEYKVHDENKGDVRSQHETREGDKIGSDPTVKRNEQAVQRVPEDQDRDNKKHQDYQAPLHEHNVQVQRETRDFDKVKEISVQKGTGREVHQVADHKKGFDAEDKIVGHTVHEVPTDQLR